MSRNLADLDILDLPVRLDCPGLDAVVVIDGVDTADSAQSILAWLDVAGVVDGARLQQELVTVPVKFKVEAHASLVEDWPVDTRCAPIASAVDRHVDTSDLASSRPGQARYHVKAFLFNRRLRRWRSNYRICIHHEGELACFAVCKQVGVFGCLFAGKPRLIAHLDATKPFDPDIAFPAGDHETYGIA